MKVVFYANRPGSEARALLAAIRSYGHLAYLRSELAFDFIGNDLEADADVVLVEEGERGSMIAEHYRAFEARGGKRASGAAVSFRFFPLPAQGSNPHDVLAWAFEHFSSNGVNEVLADDAPQTPVVSAPERPADQAPEEHQTTRPRRRA